MRCPRRWLTVRAGARSSAACGAAACASALTHIVVSSCHRAGRAAAAPSAVARGCGAHAGGGRVGGRLGRPRRRAEVAGRGRHRGDDDRRAARPHARDQRAQAGGRGGGGGRQAARRGGGRGGERQRCCSGCQGGAGCLSRASCSGAERLRGRGGRQRGCTRRAGSRLVARRRGHVAARLATVRARSWRALLQQRRALCATAEALWPFRARRRGTVAARADPAAATLAAVVGSSAVLLAFMERRSMRTHLARAGVALAQLAWLGVGSGPVAAPR
jgi:hypothetical protein